MLGISGVRFLFLSQLYHDRPLTWGHFTTRPNHLRAATIYVLEQCLASRPTISDASDFLWLIERYHLHPDFQTTSAEEVLFYLSDVSSASYICHYIDICTSFFLSHHDLLVRNPTKNERLDFVDDD